MEQLLNDFSPGLFFMQAFILLVLIVLMKKFAWKPILEALDTREEDIKNAIEAAKKAKEELANLNAQNEQLLKEARAEKDALLQEASASAKSIIAEAKDKAKTEAQLEIDKATAAIASEKSAALATIRTEAVALSLQMAEKVLRGELSDKNAQEALLAKYVEEADLTAI